MWRYIWSGEQQNCYYNDHYLHLTFRLGRASATAREEQASSHSGQCDGAGATKRRGFIVCGGKNNFINLYERL